MLRLASGRTQRAGRCHSGAAPPRAGRVRPGEDPVLPGGEPGEDLRLQRLRAGEPQVGLHPGECVRAERGPFLQCDPHLVLPVQVVRANVTRPRSSASAASTGRPVCCSSLATGPGRREPCGQPGQAARRRVRAEVRRGEHRRAAGLAGPSSGSPSSMYWRSQASASSSNGPAKQLPGSISAIRLRLVTSSRFSVRFRKCRISPASQSWPWSPRSAARSRASCRYRRWS